ncbi:MAG: GNAT family N-acetyltransferase [Pyrinomonadaceae bacterium]
MDRNLTIRALAVEDAAELAAMLSAQPPEYSRFFYPFSFDEAALAKILGEQGRDVYMGVYWRGRMVGFFMLRGWNEGFDVPAFGILIDERHRGSGLEMVSLDAAKTICRLRGAGRMMLKMHPDNFSARGVARKIGFVRTGVEPESGNVIYHMDINGRAAES